MPNAVATRDKQEIVKSLNADAMKAKLEAALPQHIPTDTMLRFTMLALQKQPKLLECSKLSVLEAVMECAQLGLPPDGVLGHAYFVPYGKKCQLIVGYRGLQSLAIRSGKVRSIYAEVVYSNDHFAHRIGDDPSVEHERALADQGDIIAVYAVAHLTDTDKPVLVVMTKAEVDAIRKRSAASGSGPWVTDYGEMMKKTAIRRLCKNLPLSPELVKAATTGEYHEAGTLHPRSLDLKTAGRHSIDSFDLTPKQVTVESETQPPAEEPDNGMPNDEDIEAGERSAIRDE